MTKYLQAHSEGLCLQLWNANMQFVEESNAAEFFLLV